VALIESTISFFCAMTPTGFSGPCNSALQATSMKVSVGERLSKPADASACQKMMDQENPDPKDIESCKKGTDVTITEISAKEQMNATENQFQQYMLDESYKMVGKNTIYTLGGAAFLYNTYTTKKLTVDIPNAKICDTLHADVAPDSYGLRLQWNFK
jgi:hypothetical protein